MESETAVDDGVTAPGSLDPLEEPSEVGCRAVQRHGVEQFEATGESVLEGVGRPRAELLVCRFSPVPPHFPCEVLGCVQLVFDERLEDGEPRPVVRDLDLLPRLDLQLHRLESALGLVDADGDGVFQVQVLAVLREDDVEVAGEGQVRAYEDAQLCGAEIYAEQRPQTCVLSAVDQDLLHII